METKLAKKLYPHLKQLKMNTDFEIIFNQYCKEEPLHLLAQANALPEFSDKYLNKALAHTMFEQYLLDIENSALDNEEE